MIDWATIKPGLKTLLSSLSGLPVDTCVYFDEGQVVAGAALRLALRSPTSLGIDEQRETSDQAGVATATVAGPYDLSAATTLTVQLNLTDTPESIVFVEGTNCVDIEAVTAAEIATALDAMTIAIDGDVVGGFPVIDAGDRVDIEVSGTANAVIQFPAITSPSVTLTYYGNRIFTLSITAESTSHEANEFAPDYLEKIRARIRRESSHAALESLGLALVDAFNVVEVPFHDGDRFWSSYVLDVRFACASVDEDTEYDGSWIQSVEITSPFAVDPFVVSYDPA